MSFVFRIRILHKWRGEKYIFRGISINHSPTQSINQLINRKKELLELFQWHFQQVLISSRIPEFDYSSIFNFFASVEQVG